MDEVPQSKRRAIIVPNLKKEKKEDLENHRSVGLTRIP